MLFCGLRIVVSAKPQQNWGFHIKWANLSLERDRESRAIVERLFVNCKNFGDASPIYTFNMIMSDGHVVTCDNETIVI
jgi:hypothetical protein